MRDLKFSTGLVNHLAVTGALKGGLDGGFIKVYSGTIPDTADAAIAGGNTLLVTISVNGGGGGLNFDATATSGTLPKASGETWEGTNVATGTATFYRHVTSSDTGGASTTERRIQGTCGVGGNYNMELSSTALTSGVPFPPITTYTVTLLTQR